MHTYTQPKAPKQNKLTPTAQVFNLGGFSLRAFFSSEKEPTEKLCIETDLKQKKPLKP